MAEGLSPPSQDEETRSRLYSLFYSLRTKLFLMLRGLRKKPDPIFDAFAEGAWYEGGIRAHFKLLHEKFNLSYSFLNKFFNNGFGPAGIALAWPFFLTLAFFIAKIILAFVYGQSIAESALAAGDLFMTMIFWEAGYSLGALLLAPLLLTPFGMGGMLALVLTILICAVTSGLADGLWSLIKYQLKCTFGKKRTVFEWSEVKKLCFSAFAQGANFVLCSFAFIFSATGIVNIILEVATTLETSIVAGIISWYRDRVGSKEVVELDDLAVDENAATAAQNHSQKVSQFNDLLVAPKLVETQVAVNALDNSATLQDQTTQKVGNQSDNLFDAKVKETKEVEVKVEEYNTMMLPSSIPAASRLQSNIRAASKIEINTQVIERLSQFSYRTSDASTHFKRNQKPEQIFAENLKIIDPIESSSKLTPVS